MVARAEEPDLPLPLMDGYDALIRRVRVLADRPELSERARNVIDELLEYHDGETAAREIAESYLAAAEQHVEAYRMLERHAGERGVPVAGLDAWPQWRETAELLADIGKAVLSNDDRYGAWLDAMTIGKARARLTVEQLRTRLREDRVETPAPQQELVPEQEGFAHMLDRSPAEPVSKADQEKGFAHTLDRPPATPVSEAEQEQGFAHILDDPEKLRELREKAEERDRKLGRHMRRSRGLSI